MNLYSNDLFRVNPRAEITVEYIGYLQSCLVTVDNVLVDPLAAREFLKKIPQQDALREPGRRPPGFFPGYQTYVSYDFLDLNNLINQQLNQHFGLTLRRPNWSYQTCSATRPVYVQSRYPHCDSGQIAANLFLNTDLELTQGLSGTGFYRFRRTGEEAAFPSACQYRKQRYGYDQPQMDLAPLEPILDTPDWQQYHLSRQAFNRLNIYESGLFHLVYFEQGMFQDSNRITLSMLDS